MKGERIIKKSTSPILVWMFGIPAENKQSFTTKNLRRYIIGEEFDMEVDPTQFKKSIENDNINYIKHTYCMVFPSKEAAVNYFNEEWRDIDANTKIYKVNIPEGTYYAKFKNFWVTTTLDILEKEPEEIYSQEPCEESIFEPEDKEDTQEEFRGWIVLRFNPGENKLTDPYSGKEIVPRAMYSSYNKYWLGKSFRIFVNKADAEKEYYKAWQTQRLYPAIIPCNKSYTIEGDYCYSDYLCVLGLENINIETPALEDYPAENKPADNNPPKNGVEGDGGERKADDKKSVTEYVGYNSHVMLNPPYLTATSSITCIDSYQRWEKAKDRENTDEDGYRDMLVEIADCRGKIRLHNRGGDLKDFENKVQTLYTELGKFLDHIRTHKDPEDVIKSAKKKFPTRYDK